MVIIGDNEKLISLLFFDYSVLTFCYALYAVIISFYYSKAGRRNKNYYNVRV